MRDISGPPGVIDLPAELILHILGYLELLDLANVAQTCSTLHRHSCDDTIWQPIVNTHAARSISEPHPLKSFRELYMAHHPYWFLARNKIWFSDTKPCGKLLISRYEPATGCIAAYTVTAVTGPQILRFWEKDPNVIIHSFDPEVSLDLCRPVLKLEVDDPKTDGEASDYSVAEKRAPYSNYGKEKLMDVFPEEGVYASFILCRALPEIAISEGTQVWPPLRFPAKTRTRNLSGDDFNSLGHRPETWSQISKNNFRLRRWAEYTGRSRMPGGAPGNVLAAALGRVGPYFAARLSSTAGGRISIRRSDDLATYATLPESCYTPTTKKPWQGIWCGDYSGHGCEFLVIRQPDEGDAQPLPEGMDRLRQWFRGGHTPDFSNRYVDSSANQEDGEVPEDGDENQAESSALGETDCQHPPSGRLEAIKLTGDLNIPRGEYTFIAPDIGPGGLIRVADEESFRGARVVKSAGHVAHRHFENDQYLPSQLIMISHNKLAQFWDFPEMGHISYYQRVDLDALTNYAASTEINGH